MTHQPETMWVTIAHLRDNLQRMFQQRSECIAFPNKGDRVCLKEGWWTIGELKTIQTKDNFEIWCIINMHRDDFQIPSPLHWAPTMSNTNTRLMTYVQVMSGSHHLTGSIPVTVTDGTYR